jgi:hypothetical protein
VLSKVFVDDNDTVELISVVTSGEPEMLVSSEVDGLLVPLAVDEVLLTIKDDIVDVINVAEFVTLVCDDVIVLSVIPSPSKIKEKLTMNIVRSYYIHRD